MIFAPLDALMQLPFEGAVCSQTIHYGFTWIGMLAIFFEVEISWTFVICAHTGGFAVLLLRLLFDWLRFIGRLCETIHYDLCETIHDDP